MGVDSVGCAVVIVTPKRWICIDFIVIRVVPLSSNSDHKHHRSFCG